MSGFTGAGYPKAVPQALAAMMTEHRSRGEDFRIGVWTGASTAPELDGALAAADGIELRLPYQSDPVSRARINAGTMEYIDVHLSHVAQMAWEGFLGHLDVALVEVTGITEDGRLVPSSSVGNNKTWIDLADWVILEVNAWQPMELHGMHDVYYGTALPPDRRPIMITSPGDRIGIPHFVCPAEKIVAIVETDAREHIMGSRIQNGIGGSGDFARNAFISTFVTPSGQGRGPVVHRADGLARRPHRARRRRADHRAGPG